MRNLERQIANVARRIARDVAVRLSEARRAAAAAAPTNGVEAGEHPAGADTAAEAATPALEPLEMTPQKVREVLGHAEDHAEDDPVAVISGRANPRLGEREAVGIVEGDGSTQLALEILAERATVEADEPVDSSPAAAAAGRRRHAPCRRPPSPRPSPSAFFVRRSTSPPAPPRRPMSSR